jgi:hypothetical protein
MILHGTTTVYNCIDGSNVHGVWKQNEADADHLGTIGISSRDLQKGTPHLSPEQHK